MGAGPPRGSSNIEAALLLHKSDPFTARYAGDRKPQQRPSALFVPGLVARPWWDVQQLRPDGGRWWGSELCSAASEIFEEFGALRAAEPAADGRRWPRWPLMAEGAWAQEHCRRCPRTASLLRTLPLCDSSLGHAYFSVLPPDSRVGRHCGVTNLKLRGHLGLHTPGAECGIRVQDEARAWEERGLLVFDDSFEHEAWNGSRRERVVLVFDIWHPQLTAKDMASVRAHFPAATPAEAADASRMPWQHVILSSAGRPPVAAAASSHAVPVQGQPYSMATLAKRVGLARKVILALPVTDLSRVSCSCTQWRGLLASEEVWGSLLRRDFSGEVCTARGKYERYKEFSPKLERCPQQEGYDLSVKLLLVGDAGVGKSSVMQRLVDETYTEGYVTTIGVDFKWLPVRCHGLAVRSQIWDTAGPERFRSITRAFYRGCHGVLLVYDQTDKESFRNVERWHDDIVSHGREGIKMVLCANKCDLPPEVTPEEGMAMAVRFGIGFAQTSAKTGSGVERAAARLLHMSVPAARRESLSQPPRRQAQCRKPTVCCVL